MGVCKAVDGVHFADVLHMLVPAVGISRRPVRWGAQMVGISRWRPHVMLPHVLTCDFMTRARLLTTSMWNADGTKYCAWDQFLWRTAYRHKAQGIKARFTLPNASARMQCRDDGA